MSRDKKTWFIEKIAFFLHCVRGMMTFIEEKKNNSSQATISDKSLMNLGRALKKLVFLEDLDADFAAYD